MRFSRWPVGGGYGFPPMMLFCCHCRRRIPKSQMVKETNRESPVYGQWSCQTHYEGPQPDRTYNVSGPDDLGVELNRQM